MTVEETSIFWEILADLVNYFMITLEKKALEKTLSREAFEKIEKFERALEEPNFEEKNGEKLPIKKVWLAGKVDPQLFKIIIHTNMYVLTQWKHHFISKYFLKWTNVLTSIKKPHSAGEKDDAADFDEDKEDHYNFIELAEEYGKN